MTAIAFSNIATYDKRKYRVGMCRYSEKTPVEQLATHLYELVEGQIMDFGLPMCKKGWNADRGQSYSILRGQLSKKGICKNCLKRAAQGLPGVLPNDCEVEAIFDDDNEEKDEEEMA